MKTINKMLICAILLFGSTSAMAQEWANLNTYKKATGQRVLQEGNWLKKDRKQQSKTWDRANTFNLSQPDASAKYRSISQIRDFYKWFDRKKSQKGHEIKWPGIAAIVAGQLALLDGSFVRCIFVRNKEVVQFAHQGSQEVFTFAFPLLRKVYLSEEVIKGEAARLWDDEYGHQEQCLVLDSLYQTLSPEAIKKLNNMAKGKGIFRWAVRKQLSYEGDIKDCQKRFEHGKYKVGLLYDRRRKKDTTQ